ncbi:ATP-dependent RNA helicase SrmB [Candidatus Lokiarchaeum ossiferum]|uniref:ATP-dependent RNA helicase SrmB n=1 Tax=Candidatus Lokiarchaeum ossiferum TaxID=2951803 RepID=A0ABY6HYV1_9ARCH|nr:ATP-dependent RNA helicase SrmB [Candidatus Lokiarchaeum sp. B-35]
MAFSHTLEVVNSPPQFYNHPLLKENLIEWREYQVTIAEIASKQNTLVVLPTALGKTIIALFTIAHILQRAPDSKIFILAPTRPLVMQHFQSFQSFLVPQIKCCLFSSNLSPIKRAYVLNDHQIFFSTPQILQNDLKSELYSLDGVSQIIFDETHKAQKRYAYTFVARTYLEQCAHPIILGLTASPGKDLFKINQLCETLQIERIIFRDSDSADVQEYTHGINSIIHKIELPDEITKAKLILDTLIRKIRDFLVEREVLPPRRYTSKFQFIQLIQDLKKLEILLDPHYIPHESVESSHTSTGEEELNYPHLLELFQQEGTSEIVMKQTSTIFSKAINGIYLEHLKEILTTQDVRLFRTYLQKLRNRAQTGNYRIKQLLNSKYIKGVIQILQPIQISPKIKELQQIIYQEYSTDTKAKIIIFTQYREMGQYLVENLSRNITVDSSNIISIKAQRFVGQASRENDKGLSQKDQNALIKDFSLGKFNILVATSVAEEGLDIPNVNAVIFYDAVPSEIRLIQRRGRTGRHQIGRCYFLVTSNTLDEIYHHVSHRREMKMSELLKSPEAINTVKSLHRSKSLPSHKIQPLEMIQNRYKQLKDSKQQKTKEKIEELIKQNESNHLNQRANSGFEYVSSFSQLITEKKEKEISRNKITQKQFQVKWIFDWIINTMETLGTQVGNRLYCSLDDLHQAAIEENFSILKMDKEIEFGMKMKHFSSKNSMIIYKFL